MSTKRSPSRLSRSSIPPIPSPTPLNPEQYQLKSITKWSAADVSSFIRSNTHLPLDATKELANFVFKREIDGKGFLRMKPEDLRASGVNIKWCRELMDILEVEKRRRVMAKNTRSQSRTGTRSPLDNGSVYSEDEARTIYSEFDHGIHTSDGPTETVSGLDIPIIPEGEFNAMLTPESPTPEDFSRTIEETIQERLEMQRAEFDQALNERLLEQKASLEQSLHRLIHIEHSALQGKLQQSFEEHQHCMKAALQQQMSDYDQILREQTEDTLEAQKFVLEKIIACKVEELKGLVTKEGKNKGLDRWEEVMITMEKWKIEIQELKGSLLCEKELPKDHTFWSRYFGFFLTGLTAGSLLGLAFLRYSR
ncbi:hypothetical protein K493DRAFT_303908 [Basidiobolus meristosporus CBS 931.73]|uniref:SAM domain-containing protein n=1 Tax=Basidiobolus meristosporus CBS 931.73 TaxID=1314790 RepID=A0A1Y1Y1Z1_9FUNG|nr:hypothetical protein K493DRAFT_303908 [Basidiobolus meristosporus CBS 931.73]|eukprot:ORX91644.1 hypothetical protein K493DRAFT_303908 [Basidiobolus meristosporus CBS 931.73]